MNYIIILLIIISCVIITYYYNKNKLEHLDNVLSASRPGTTSIPDAPTLPNSIVALPQSAQQQINSMNNFQSLLNNSSAQNTFNSMNSNMPPTIPMPPITPVPVPFPEPTMIPRSLSSPPSGPLYYPPNVPQSNPSANPLPYQPANPVPYPVPNPLPNPLTGPLPSTNNSTNNPQTSKEDLEAKEIAKAKAKETIQQIAALPKIADPLVDIYTKRDAPIGNAPSNYEYSYDDVYKHSVYYDNTNTELGITQCMHKCNGNCVEYGVTGIAYCFLADK